jgi:hypothetical protein
MRPRSPWRGEKFLGGTAMSPRQDRSDEVSVELEVMQTIADALARLRDPQAQWRVLCWTTDRLLAAPTDLAADLVLDAVAEPALEVDELHDLFEVLPGEPPAELPRPARQAVGEEPLDSLVRGFATELQRLALEWQSA